MSEENEGECVSSSLAVIDKVVPNGWKMKLAKAAAQLIAGSEKGAVAYGELRERIDTIEGRSVVSKALAQAIAQQAVGDPEMLERAKARFLGRAIQQQENVEAVVAGASQHLPLLPAPIEPVASEDATSKGQENNQEVPEESLNSDWAATFTGFAENASSEDLRDRLSRVLAGELKSPGTYPRSTVRIIAELERSDLEAVRNVLPYAFGNYLIRTEGAEPLPSIDMLLPLVDAGLVADANPMLGRTWPAALEDESLCIVGGYLWGLGVYVKKGQSLRVPIVPLTRTGIAVANLLERPDEKIILRSLAERLPSDLYSKIVIGQMSGENRIFNLQQILPSPMYTNVTPLGGSGLRL